MKVVKIGTGKEPLKRCVVSLGVGKKVFSESLHRLEESLRRVGFEGDYISWGDRLPDGCPEHFEAPFAFKTYCIYTAKSLGYQQILWMDSACIAIRSLKPIFHHIEANGYVMFNNNYDQMMGQWISDEALAQNGMTRNEAMLIPELPCSVLGLDMNSELATSFLDNWHKIMADGVTARGIRKKIENWDQYQAIFWNRDHCISSDPRARGHRCDQPAAGIVAHRLGMTPYADELRDIHYKQKPVKHNTVILHHREFGGEITPLNQIYFRTFIHEPFIGRPRKKLADLFMAIKAKANAFNVR